MPCNEQNHTAMAKRIIIIGASSGIGERIALDLARAGMLVGIAARREDKLKAISELVPDKIVYKTIDVTADNAQELFYDLIKMRDGMDILLFAAGCGYQDPDLNPERVTETLRINVVGFARIMTAAFKYFRDTANVAAGHIAAITSIAGTKGMGLSAAYSSSKRFQQTFINALEQLAYTKHVNVRFTDIRPGFIRTALLDPKRSYPMEMSIDYACPKIERAILTGRRVAYIDSRWRIVNGLWRMIPQCLWKHISLGL